MIKLSDYIIGYLERLNTGHMFMLPGGGAMHLNDSLGKSKKIEYVCCLHEQACAIAAEAYARVTNNIGLLMVTTGPGGTNALTGIAAAYIESTPVLIISGQVKIADQIRNQNIRQQGMQELDIISIVKPVTKYAAMVTDPATVKYHLDRAVYEAQHGRPGPVWLDIPLDVQAAQIDEAVLAGYEPPPESHGDMAGTVSEIIDILNRSERPVLLAGNGIRLSGAIEEFRQMAELLDIPVLTTWNGIDLIWEEHPLYYGRPGGIGHRYANFIQQNSDFFISVGARLNLLQTGYNFDGFARCAQKIMVDIDPYELRKINVRPDIPVCADAGRFIREIIRQKDKILHKDRKPWYGYCDRVKQAYPLITNDMRTQKEKVSTYLLLETISGLMDHNDIYVAGSSGTCIDISMQAFKVKKGQRAFTTKGLASMGYCLPSTIGAALASGGKRTVCVTGDGGFQMNIQELETIRRLGLPIKVFVLDNGGYAMIKGTQTNLFDGHFVACTRDSKLTMPDITDVANAYKLRTLTISGNDELQSKVAEALFGDDPVICVVNVPIDLPVMPKQVSYKRKDGQMESLPLEYMRPPLSDEEFESNMLIPIYEKG
ncbi:MAG: thiamine pyrophosphate-binding protein [Chitinispirillia bacterium]|nr:thiamine pyrophosphate-binding protein [Chitinispirillia bacterium]MCL2241448.1 thiamine pyrophosphate-binding protein [Chitinispirillia bacterium]